MVLLSPEAWDWNSRCEMLFIWGFGKDQAWSVVGIRLSLNRGCVTLKWPKTRCVTHKPGRLKRWSFRGVSLHVGKELEKSDWLLPQPSLEKGTAVIRVTYLTSRFLACDWRSSSVKHASGCLGQYFTCHHVENIYTT
jgi:hypothetical protein